MRSLLILLFLAVSTVMNAQMKLVIYKGANVIAKYNVSSDVDSIQFKYEEPSPEPTPDPSGNVYKPSTFPVPAAVDLGLPSGTKWAAWNVGATSVASLGGYYGWGDPTGELTAKDPAGSYYTFTEPKNIAGTEHDIVTAKYGTGWSLPTKAQLEELINSQYTNVESVSDYLSSGISGLLISNKSDATKFIFLPTAGYVNASNTCVDKDRLTYYWSSQSDYTYVYYAQIFASDFINWGLIGANLQLPVRGVYVQSGGDTPSGEDLKGHAAVDLGLSVKWATTNVGAETSYGYGNYYSWGSVETQYDYTISAYSLYDQPISVWNETTSQYMLPAEYDVATTLWGGKWRMPTWKEMSELVQECDCVWTEINGVYGCKVSNKSDATKYIFLPAAGYKAGSASSTNTFSVNTAGYYWSSTDLEKNKDEYAVYVTFDQSDKAPYTTSMKRFNGLPIRPVYGDRP